MARGGINQVTVQRARSALIARGEYPSIDAVRVEMGNTGSKTTIHRYLKSLEDHDHSGSVATQIGDELTELVTRLAQRLQGQAQETIEQAQAGFDAASRSLNEELMHTRSQLAAMTDRLQREGENMATQAATLHATRERLQTEQTQNARLTQARQDMTTRITEKDSQIRSLDEQLLEARHDLERQRNSAIKQREQDQTRHEEQLRLVQAELRLAQENTLQRQEQMTALNRDNERLLAANESLQQELGRQQASLSQNRDLAERATEQFRHSETRCALLEERAGSAQKESAGLRQQLTDQLQQNRLLELLLIKAEVALETARNSGKETADASAKPENDQS